MQLLLKVLFNILVDNDLPRQPLINHVYFLLRCHKIIFQVIDVRLLHFQVFSQRLNLLIQLISDVTVLEVDLVDFDFKFFSLRVKFVICYLFLFFNFLLEFQFLFMLLIPAVLNLASQFFYHSMKVLLLCLLLALFLLSIFAFFFQQVAQLLAPRGEITNVIVRHLELVMQIVVQ